MPPTTAPTRPRPSAKLHRSKKQRRTAAKAGRTVAPEDLLQFQLLGDPQISPDGSHVLFSHKRIGEKNAYWSNIWIVPAGGGEARPFTTGNKDGHGRWSPDGSKIAFISGREKPKPQIYLIEAGGGEARKLTNFPEGSIATFKWSPDGTKLAVSFREQDPEWTEKAKKDREEKGLTTPPRVLDDWWYRLDGDGYFNHQRHHLYIVDVVTGKHEKVYDQDTLGQFSFDFSPDSKRIALTSNRAPKALIEQWKIEVLILDLKTRKVKALPNIPDGPKTCIHWSPNGRWLAWAAREGREETQQTENVNLYVCDANKGGATNLTGNEDYCLMAINATDAAEMVFGPTIRWHPDSKRIFMQIGWHGETHIASIPVTGGTLTFHTRGERVHQLGNFSSDGKQLALMVGEATALDEVHVANVVPNTLKPRSLTSLNKPLFDELQLATMESHWVESDDGTKVQVWTLTPPGAPKRGKRPAILEIHGGPHAQYGVGYFHEMQVLAAQGYIVVFSNPRGSKGYGESFCDAIRGTWGEKDWEDIQAVMRFMKQHPRIDPKRMGVAGGSYGGFMTNWIIGHTHDFAAAITDRCVSNLVSMFGNHDFVMRPDHYWKGNSWDRPESLWEHSPLRFLGNAKTPTLIIHSEGDLRCNVEQAEQVFTVLKLNDVPCRFVRYPRETSHGMSRGGPPDMRLHRFAQMIDWWKKWL